MNTAEIIKQGTARIMNTYGRYPAVMVKGRGCRLTDSDGREYLDFLAGIAVCSLGHGHPGVSRAICRQAETLLHVSNLYHTLPQTELADRLVENSFADRVFFCNSGAEANEAAIKLARKHGGAGRYEIISLQGSFHGRTLATVAATGQRKFHRGFEPLPAGFVHAPFADLAALEEKITTRTCAVLVEPLQGEGGVRPLPGEYLRGIRELCDRHDILLIFDEIQVGMGRTGRLFAHEHEGVVPDIMTLAKALANGLPMGAMLAGEAVAASFSPGDHASTFGGNPVAAAAALVVMDELLTPGFLEEVAGKGRYFADRLADLAQRYPAIAVAPRGLGLIQGLVLTADYLPRGPEIVMDLFNRGFLINFAGNAVLRFLPPLIVSTAEIDQLIETLAEVFEGLSR